MKVDLEVVLNWRDGDWIARHDDFTVRGATWDTLESRLRDALSASRRYPPGSTVKVMMACDASMIPDWMRPYQQHYFNRIETLVLDSEPVPERKG